MWIKSSTRSLHGPPASLHPWASTFTKKAWGERERERKGRGGTSTLSLQAKIPESDSTLESILKQSPRRLRTTSERLTIDEKDNRTHKHTAAEVRVYMPYRPASQGWYYQHLQLPLPAIFFHRRIAIPQVTQCQVRKEKESEGRNDIATR